MIKIRLHTSLGRSSLATSVMVLAIALLNVSDLDAFERNVLFEEFTSTTCGTCAQLAPEVEEALEEAGDMVVGVATHVWWPNPGDDPWYTDNTQDAQTRVGYYHVNATPTFFTDGSFTARNGDAILEAIEERSEELSPLRIQVSGYIVDDELRVAVNIYSEEEMEEDLEDLTLQVALKEVYYNYNGRNGLRDHYNPMLKMISNANGTQFDIAADEIQEFAFTQSMEDLGWHELEIDNLALVVWVQAESGEVYQAQGRSLAIESPYIEVVDLEVIESENADDDGRVEPGEQAELVVTLENHEDYLEAESIEIRLSTDDEGVIIEAGVVEIDALPNGERIDNSESPFHIEIAEEFVAKPVTFTFTVIAQPGDFEQTTQLTAMIGWPQILLVNASQDEDAGEAMAELFGVGELPYADRWTRTVDGEVTSVDLNNYSSIIWHSFNNEEDVITIDEEQVLMEFLDDGGALVTSSSYLTVHHADSRLVREYLSVSLDQADTGARLVVGEDEELQFGGANLILAGEGQAEPRITPSLTPLGEAAVVMNYVDEDEEVGVAAVKNEADQYRTLLLAFPLESIIGMDDADEIDAFMTRIWSWIANPPLTVREKLPTPYTLQLMSPFPNPFNSQIVVPFSLDTPGHFRLSIYDLTGREIDVLTDNHLSAGDHQMLWDADGLSSGIYVVRLSAFQSVQTAKIILIR